MPETFCVGLYLDWKIHFVDEERRFERLATLLQRVRKEFSLYKLNARINAITKHKCKVKVKQDYNGPRREKICLKCFRQSEIQNSLLIYRD